MSGPLSLVVVTGLSGGGKASILRALEDVGFEAVDNPPVTLLEDMVARGDHKLAIGIDARSRGFDAAEVLATLARLKQNPSVRVRLVYAWADESTLLRRYTETRRRHPLAQHGMVADGIAAEIALTDILREKADLVVDTTELPINNLRRLIERHFGEESAETPLTVTLMSFAYPKGLPREADLVFDARFLRNPHYDPILRPKTGMDADVGAYVEADPDFGTFFSRVAELIELVLPRFVQEGKKYATITIGCTGGRHRSVYLVERLAARLISGLAVAGEGNAAWRILVTHRELARAGESDVYLVDRPVARRGDSDIESAARALSVQA